MTTTKTDLPPTDLPPEEYEITAESGEFPLTAEGRVPYYAVARAMAESFPDDGFDWDAWKDQMKEGDW